MTELDLLRKKLERERRAREEAEEIIENMSRKLYSAKLTAELASKTKSEFLANMNHELRTPLNGILGFCDVLLSQVAGDLTGDQLDFLTQIRSSGARLAKTFGQIMSIASLQDGTEILRIEEVAVEDTIADMLSAAGARAQAQEMIFTVDIEAELPIVKADPIALLKMISNLIDNALKYSQPGKEILFLAYKNTEGAVQIDVIDQGLGMTEEELRNAIVPFYQADGGLSRKHEGAGLGLSIVQGLAEAQGASFALFSVPHTVTRASIVFPLGDRKGSSSASLPDAGTSHRPVRTTVDRAPAARGVKSL